MWSCDRSRTRSTHCITLPHTALHCNTLHYTATHCDTGPPRYAYKSSHLVIKGYIGTPNEFCSIHYVIFQTRAEEGGEGRRVLLLRMGWGGFCGNIRLFAEMQISCVEISGSFAILLDERGIWGYWRITRCHQHLVLQHTATTHCNTLQ